MEFITDRTIIYTLVIISLVLAFIVLRLDWKLRKFMSGRTAKSLENHFVDMQKELNNLYDFKKQSELHFQRAFKELSKSVQGVHTVKFNAFQGLESGGDNSFATALVNKNGDGVIISTLHARDRVNVFSKPISNFKTLHQLTDEEKEALTKACESCKL